MSPVGRRNNGLYDDEKYIWKQRMIHSTAINCLAGIKIIAQNFSPFRSNKTSKLYSDFFSGLHACWNKQNYSGTDEFKSPCCFFNDIQTLNTRRIKHQIPDVKEKTEK